MLVTNWIILGRRPWGRGRWKLTHLTIIDRLCAGKPDGGSGREGASRHGRRLDERHTHSVIPPPFSELRHELVALAKVTDLVRGANVLLNVRTTARHRDHVIKVQVIPGTDLAGTDVADHPVLGEDGGIIHLLKFSIIVRPSGGIPGRT